MYFILPPRSLAALPRLTKTTNRMVRNRQHSPRDGCAVWSRAISDRRPGDPAVLGLPEFAEFAAAAERRPVDDEPHLVGGERYVVPTDAPVAEVHRGGPGRATGVPVDPASDGGGANHQR